MACERWSPFTENTESPQAETTAKITMKIWVVWPRKRNRKTHRGSHSKLDKIELCCAGQFSIHPQKENGPGLSRPLSNREFCIERNLKKWCHTSYLKRIQQKNSIRIIFNHQEVFLVSVFLLTQIHTNDIKLSVLYINKLLYLAASSIDNRNSILIISAFPR